jgi:CubicO group peptidase (beta-lactamase class C family)
MKKLVKTNARDIRFARVCAEAERQMRRLKIPGVAIGLLHKGREYYAGLGVTSVENPLPVTGDTLFQIASVSKTFMAQAVMRLVEARRLSLDVPIRRYLPGFHMRSERVTRSVTMRHLLTHTGGWVGDYFNDFGGGTDALEKMVRSMRSLPQASPLGEIWSYNNAGFYLAAHILEKLTGNPFEQVIREQVFEPLGLKNTFYSHSEVMTHSFAVGHHIVKNRPVVARPYGQGRSTSPAGGIITSPRDMLRYARFHIGDGVFDGKRLISRQGMRMRYAPAVEATAGKKMGLAWFTFPSENSLTLWHGGSINGQKTDFRIIPDKKFGLGIFSNSDYGGEVCAKIAETALKEFLAIRPPADKPIVLSRVEQKEYFGHYDVPLSSCEVRSDARGLLIKITDKGGFPTPSSPPTDQPPPARIAFYAKDKIMGIKSPYLPLRGEFLRDAAGKIKWLMLMYRAYKRIHR